jgi:tRNA threonylcarbamoyladenosine biosynthesis protein TsaE
MILFEKEISSINELNETAQTLLKQFNSDKLFCFKAAMGAGKTTFIKHLCQIAGYDGLVNSPTFPIINVYENEQIKIAHIDCYRLRDADEAIHIGIENYFDTADYCFIEWAEIIEKILPLNCVEIKIEIINETSRKIIAHQFAEKK